MREFTYDMPASRVLFGSGRLGALSDECAVLGIRRALLIASQSQHLVAEEAATRLADRCVGIVTGVAMHVPLAHAESARIEARRLHADGCIAIGGGSAIGLAKAIALSDDLPIIAVPTTYAGSELTPIWGLTADGEKRTGRDRRVLPRVVIYDPILTLSLPPEISGPSGINALAHCVEALYAPDGNPITALMAAEGARALARSLPLVVAAPFDLQARADALYGAWLAGASLGAVSMGLHHKLCHTLGGAYGLPHAQLHTVILPYVVAYNAEVTPQAMSRLAWALDDEDPAGAIFDLAGRLGAQRSLAALGMTERDLDAAAELAVRNPYANPAPVTRAGIRRLLEAAYHGLSPRGG